MALLFKALDFVPAWLYAGALALLLAAFGWQAHVLRGSQADLLALRLEVAASTAAQAELGRLARIARDAEQADLRTRFANIDQRTNDETIALALRVRALERELQHRPERPAAGAGAGVPGGAGTALACTGAQLYRADAAFLAGEAARADALRIQLADCRARYDAAAQMSAHWHNLQTSLTNTLTNPTPKGSAP